MIRIVGALLITVGGIGLMAILLGAFLAILAAGMPPAGLTQIFWPSVALATVGAGLWSWRADAAVEESEPSAAVSGWRLFSWDLAALVPVLALFGVIVGRQIAIGALFGPDETEYALVARALAEGTPLIGWLPPDPPLLSILGIAALPFGDVEVALRVIGLISGLVLLFGVWLLGRSLSGPACGLLAALAVAGIPNLQLYSSYFLTDVPASAMLILLVLLVWRRFELDEGKGGFLALAVIAAAAFYVRYSSSLPIILIGLTTVILWPGRVMAARRRIFLAVGMLALLLLPYFVLATLTTGTPWGIARLAITYSAPAHAGDALRTYLRSFPSDLAGTAAAAIMAAGLLGWLIRLVFGDRRGQTFRATTLLVFPALAQVVVLGITSLAQTRFIYFPIACLILAGSLELVSAWRRFPATRALLAVPIVLVLAASAIDSGIGNVDRQALNSPREQFIAVASRAIRADAKAGSCSVLTYLNTFVSWYSRCATVTYGFPPVAGRESLLTGEHRYLLLLAGFDPYGHGFSAGQPTGELLAGYLRFTDLEPIIVIRDPATGRIEAQIYRVHATATTLHLGAHVKLGPDAKTGSTLASP